MPVARQCSINTLKTYYTWRGEFTNAEINALHAQAFKTRIFTADEWDWQRLVVGHSLGWVVARDADVLVGFVNVIWDGFVHAWLQDTMVAATASRRGIGTQLVAAARDASREAGCEYLHVDFEPHLTSFYPEACGFSSAPPGSSSSRPVRIVSRWLTGGPPPQKRQQPDVKDGMGAWICPDRTYLSVMPWRRTSHSSS